MGSEPNRLDADLLARLFVEHSEELRKFLTGVLREPELARDAMQTAFAKLAEVGHTVDRGALKSWLFQVGFNEAMLLKRKSRVHENAREKIGRSNAELEQPHDQMVRWEQIQAVQSALKKLPGEQKEIVRQRVYSGKKFAEIAKEQGIPLGTVLTRMRLAIQKLREHLERHDHDQH